MTFQAQAHTFSQHLCDAEYLREYRELFAEDFPDQQQPFLDDQSLYSFLVRVRAKQQQSSLQDGHQLANR